jgi:hypothetical protein
MIILRFSSLYNLEDILRDPKGMMKQTGPGPVSIGRWLSTKSERSLASRVNIINSGRNLQFKY